MDAIHGQIAQFLREHAVDRQTRILAAVSGGADSMALLHALVAIGQPVCAAHVHHGLRGSEADADLAAVRARAHALGVEFASERVAAARPDSSSPEARARRLRYGALERMRAALRCRFIATAHSLDDQAETVLLRALRGTGPHGLSAIAPDLGGLALLRPLLGVRRAALRDYLEARGIGWREDSSNRDPGVPRNRLRHEVLPLLEDVQPNAARHLAALADSARELRERIEPGIERALDGAVRADRGGLAIDPEPLLRLPPDGLHRAIARLLSRAGLRERVTRVHLQRIARFLTRGRTQATLSLPGAHVLRCERERFWLGPENPVAEKSPEGPCNAARDGRFPARGRLVSIDPEDAR